MEVVPSINCADAACVKTRVKTAEALGASWVHLDVSDGVFAPHHSWGDPKEFAELHDAEEISTEVHLMVADPATVARRWLGAGVQRIIVHVESLSPETFAALAGECAEAGTELGVSVRPDTEIHELVPYLGEVVFAQLLAVPPGPSGQEFDGTIFEKLEFLRDRAPELTIEVDGGVTPDLARRLKEAGADAVVSGSHIFDARDPRAAYQELLDA